MSLSKKLAKSVEFKLEASYSAFDEEQWLDDDDEADQKARAQTSEDALSFAYD